MNEKTIRRNTLKPENVLASDRNIALVNKNTFSECKKNSVEVRALASYLQDIFDKNPDTETIDFKYIVFNEIAPRMEKKTQNGEKIGNLLTSITPKNLKGKENLLTVLEHTVDLVPKVLLQCFPRSTMYWTCDNVQKAGVVTLREIISNQMHLVCHIKRRTPRAYIGGRHATQIENESDKALKVISLDYSKAE